DDARAHAARIWKSECSACHQGAERKGPEITHGYNSRDWIRDFLRDPAGERFYGVTGISGMEPVELKDPDLAALVELIYAESGAKDADAGLVARGKQLFSAAECDGCHPAFDYALPSAGGPNLARRGARETLAEFIGRPSHPRWFGEQNE